MIWLENIEKTTHNKVISCNKVVFDKGKILKFKEELSNDKNYILISTSAYTGKQQKVNVKIPTSNGYYEYEYIGHNGNGGIGYQYIEKVYRNIKANSLQFINNIIDKDNYQSFDLSCFLEKRDFDYLTTTLLSLKYSGNIKLVEQLLPDLYYFAKEILQNISFKPLNTYDVNQLKQLLELAKSLKIDYTFYNNENIGKTIKLAENNTKILSLLKKIN